MKKVYTVIIFIFVIGLFVGCKSEDTVKENDDRLSEGLYPLTIVDKFGNEIIINEMPEKVISFSPELVEIMFALDLEDKLIGRSLYCDYPEEAKEIEDMGDLFNMNIELIVNSEPDLVLLSSMAGEDSVNALKAQGLTTLVLDADTNIAGTYMYIETIGKIFNKEDSAKDLIQNMKQEIESVINKVENRDKPTAYFIIGFGEFDSTATGDTYIGELIELTGAQNVAADGTNWMYSIEQLLEKDPDILICSKYYDAKNQIINLEGYKDLTAVKENRLYEVDENIFYRQGPRMVEAIKVLAKIFHPDVFNE